MNNLGHFYAKFKKKTNASEIRILKQQRTI